jgi:membrane protein required for colicin V production
MGNLSITPVDAVVAVVLLASAGFAFMRGFVHEVLSIAAWVGAAFAAMYGLPVARPFFRSHIGAAWAADAAAAVSIFLVSLLICSILTKAIANRVRNSALNSVDSSLGFVFGLIRGAALVCLAYMLAAWVFQSDLPGWLADAKSRPWLERGASLLRGLAPEGFGTAENGTKAVSEEARKAMELEKTYRSLTSPQPVAPTAPATREDKPGAASYDRTERNEMNRLFQSNQ